MNAVHVCRGCGRTINNEFLYCPWCGQPLDPVKDSESLDTVFDRLEDMQDHNRTERLCQLQKQLDELEKELDSIVLNTEMHK